MTTTFSFSARNRDALPRIGREIEDSKAAPKGRALKPDAVLDQIDQLPTFAQRDAFSTFEQASGTLTAGSRLRDRVVQVVAHQEGNRPPIAADLDDFQQGFVVAHQLGLHKQPLKIASQHLQVLLDDILVFRTDPSGQAADHATEIARMSRMVSGIATAMVTDAGPNKRQSALLAQLIDGISRRLDPQGIAREPTLAAVSAEAPSSHQREALFSCLHAVALAIPGRPTLPPQARAISTALTDQPTEDNGTVQIRRGYSQEEMQPEDESMRDHKHSGGTGRNNQRSMQSLSSLIGTPNAMSLNPQPGTSDWALLNGLRGEPLRVLFDFPVTEQPGRTRTSPEGEPKPPPSLAGGAETSAGAEVGSPPDPDPEPDPDERVARAMDWPVSLDKEWFSGRQLLTGDALTQALQERTAIDHYLFMLTNHLEAERLRLSGKDGATYETRPPSAFYYSAFAPDSSHLTQNPAIEFALGRPFEFARDFLRPDTGSPEVPARTLLAVFDNLRAQLGSYLESALEEWNLALEQIEADPPSGDQSEPPSPLQSPRAGHNDPPAPDHE